MLAVAVCSIVVLSPTGASAFVEPGITGSFADFANCPVNLLPPFEERSGNCLHSYVTGGVVQIGHSSAPISIPGDTFDAGGTTEEPEVVPSICSEVGLTECVVSPPHGILNGPAQPVPGGLLGTVGNSRLTGVRAKLEWAASVPPDTRFGTLESCSGTDPDVTLDICRLLTGASGTATTLSVKVHLLSPFLGPDCYIGSAAEPIVISLTTGTTDPPPPATPIHGRQATLFPRREALELRGLVLVSNSFAVPAARGCGTSGGELIDSAINHKLGLPSPAGQNKIVVNANGEEYQAYKIFEAGWTGENGSPEEEPEEGGAENNPAAGPSSLPDGRAYELVSPIAKNGLSPYAAVSSTDGEAVDFQARGALAGSGTGALNLYRAERGTDGWQTTSLTPTPSNPLGALEVQAPAWTSGDLRQTIFDTPASYASGDEDGGALSLYSSDAGGTSLLSQGTQGGNEERNATFDAATPDGQHVVFSSGASLLPNATGLEPQTAPEAQYLYQRDVSGGHTSLLSLDPVGQPVGYVKTPLPEETPSHAHLKVASVDGFAPGQFITVGTGPSAETTQITKIRAVAGTPVLVVNNGEGLQSAFPAGTPVVHLAEGAILGDGGNLAPGPPAAGEYLPANVGSGSTTNAISADGSKVFFEAPNPVTGQPVGFYMRKGNSTTVKIAGSHQYATTQAEAFPAEIDLFGSARFEGAAADGSLAFFASEEGLAGATQGRELYEFNTTDGEIGGLPPGSLRPLSAALGGDQDPATTLTSKAGDERTITVASTAGFHAGEQILFAPFEPIAGQHNSDETATIASVDSPTQFTLSGSLSGAQGVAGVAAGTEIHAVHPASVTAISNDGSHVYFVSDGGILANNQNSQGAKAIPAKPNLYLFNTTTGETTFIATVAKRDVETPEGNPTGLVAEPDISRPAVPTPDGSVLAFASAANLTGQNPWQRHTEIYRYSVSGEELQCLSCTEPGVRPTGDASFGETAGGTYAPPGLTSPITEDGQVVFFDTPDSLVSADQNAGSPPSPKFEDPTSTDVYQWTSAGLSLLSSGTSTTPAVLQGTNPSGSDVLFTATQTVPGQADGGYENVIDARLGGGFPEAVGAPSCSGAGCREAFGPPPLFAAAATQSTQGEANPSPTKKAKKKKHRKRHHAHRRAAGAKRRAAR